MAGDTNLLQIIYMCQTCKRVRTWELLTEDVKITGVVIVDDWDDFYPRQQNCDDPGREDCW